MRFGRRTRPSQSSFGWAGTPARLVNLFGMGDQFNNQIGTGISANFSIRVPAQTTNFPDVTQLEAGPNRGIIRRGGRLFAYGSNDNAATGLGTQDGITFVPTQIGAFTDWSDVSTGNIHGLAIRNGEMYAWGFNGNGRTGRNITAINNTAAPTKVGALDDWEEISAGNSHSLAIRDGGKLFSFGNNANGRTGLNTTAGNTAVPTQITGFDDWEFISAGNTHNFAIRDGGKLYSWGSNANGRTGLNTATANTEVPTQVGVEEDWTTANASIIGAGSLGVRDGGKLFAWSINSFGRTGLNTVDGQELEPTEVTLGGVSNVTSVSTGLSHSMVVGDGKLYAAGLNTFNRLGIDEPNTPNVLIFTQVTPDTDWIDVTAQNASSTALKRIKVKV